MTQDGVQSGSDDRLTDDAVVPEILRSELVYAGRVWDIRTETFRYGDAELVRDFVDHPGAVAVVPMDDEGRVLLIKQYRHPPRTRDWEFVAGLLDVENESGLAAARRELAEEADLVANEWHLLAEYLNSPGGSNEAMRIFLARGLSPAPEVFAREAEEADIEPRWVPLDDVVDAVREGRIQNSATVLGTLSAFVERERGWSGLRDPEEPWPRHPKLGH